MRAVRFVGQAGKDTYYGTTDDDWITGGLDEDYLAGGDGSDRIDGGADSDQLSGDAGDDLVFGGDGDDALYGGTGDDQIDGGAGDDSAAGGDGNDTLFGRSDNDRLDGGAGDDLVHGGTGDDTLVWNGAESGGARDSLFGGDGDDLLRLQLTPSQWASPAFQTEYAKFQTWIAGPAGSAGENGPRFVFNTLGGLTVAGVNRVEVEFVDAPTGPADRPVSARADSLSVGEDGPSVTGNVLDNDSVADGVASVELLSGTTRGTLVFNPDGSFDYTPDAARQALAEGRTATDSFTYRVTDADGDSSVATVSITTSGANDSPDARAIASLVGEDGTAPLVAAFTDVDLGDTHTIAVDTSATRGQVTVNGDGTLRYDAAGRFDNLAAGQTTTDSFTYTVTDNHGATSTANATITIVGANDAPTAQGIAGSTAEGGPSINLTPVFSDVDDGDTHTIGVNLAGTLGSVGINGDGSLRYDAAGGFDWLATGETATDSFTYTITDARGAVASATASITVTGENDGLAIITADLAGGVVRRPADAADSGSATHQTVGRIIFGDADLADSHVVSVSPLGGGYYGDLTATIAQDSTGVGTGTVVWNFTVGDGALADLAPGAPRAQDYAITLDDGHGATVTRTVTVTLLADNIAPEAFDMATTIDEDGPPITAVPFFFDPDSGDAQRISVDTTGTRGAVLVNSDGTFTYDPTGRFDQLAAGETATDAFGFTITDSAGAAASARAEVMIIGQNDAPAAAAISGTADEDNGTTLAPAFSDPDAGDTHTIALDLSGTRGRVSINADGTFRYETAGAFGDLAFDETVLDRFVYTVTDSSGARSSATATVAVSGVNHAPVTEALTVTAGEDSGPLSLTGRFTDVDAGDRFTFGVDTSTARGIVTMTGGTGMTYDPAGQFNRLGEGMTATDVFTYFVYDGQNAISSSTVTMTIVGANDAPVARSLTATTTEDSPAAALLPVFTDPDWEDSHTITVDGSDTLGRVSVNANGSLRYDPIARLDFLGEGESFIDIFSYTVTDRYGASSTAAVSVTVIGRNDTPRAFALEGSVDEDGPAVTLLPLFDDPDPNEVFSIEVNTSRTVGQVTINPDGTLQYDPNGRFEMLDSGQVAIDFFTFTITDSHGASSTATASITISGTFDTPPASLFSAGDDVVDFNDVLSFNYVAGTQYDALAGDDVVVLPTTAELAVRSGFDIGRPLHGGDGNDSLSGYVGATLYGDAGDDTVDVTAATGYGGLGNDLMIGRGFAQVMGDEGDDVLHGVGGDVVHGGEGVDEAFGSADARLFGDGGNDYLTVIDRAEAAGGNGDDALYGGIGTTLFGEQGDDTLYVLSSSQTAIGGDDSDTAVFTETDDVVDRVGNIDVERIEMAGGNDVFDVGFGASVGVNVHGGAGDDTLFGRDGTDTLSGDIGGDVVIGGAGDDSLFGGDGDDVIEGGAGNDILSGGDGTDLFQVFASGGDDTIADFQDGTDFVDARALGIGFGDITVTDTAGGALVQLGAGGPSVLMINVIAGSLDENDFLLSGGIILA